MDGLLIFLLLLVALMLAALGQHIFGKAKPKAVTRTESDFAPAQPTAPRLINVSIQYETPKLELRVVPVSRARRPGPCTLQINYTDSNGIATTRKIALYKSGATNRRFDAWCDTRQDRRTFIFSRIVNGIDLETGQILTREDIFSRVHPNRKAPESFDEW